ncbi:MAG: GNAT family N-acetyltransferase [Pseudomonadota bacterium]|nr:GNAT family N-acetyltransferase [Pseudomonadota bacterium]
MRFVDLPESHHPLVSLRPIVDADLPVWYDYLSLSLVFEHTSWNLSSWQDLAPYVWSADARTESSLLRLAIALRSSGQLVGTIGFHSVSPQNRSAELAYDLSPSLWGRGIATDACRTMVDWGHASAGLLRIQATALESNWRSAAVLQRCGFVREGLLRSYRMVRGRAGDFHMFAHVVEQLDKQPAGAQCVDSKTMGTT